MVAEPPAERVLRLSKGTLAFARQPTLTILAASLLGAVLGGFIGGATGDPLSATAVTFVGSVLGTVAGLVALRDPRRRAGLVVVYDHMLREAAQWQAESGTKMPRSRAQVLAWLQRNPGKPGSAALLLNLGRLEEADRLIEATEPSTPVEAFDLEILRQTSALLAARPIDLSEAERLRAAISDARTRRDRAQCIGGLEAMAAFDRGEDPLGVLVRGYERDGDPSWEDRPRRFLVRFLAALVIGATVGVFLFSSILGR